MTPGDPRMASAIDGVLRNPLNRRRALQGAAATAFSSLALGRFSIHETSAADAKTLVVASGADAVTLDPQVSFDGQSPLLWRAVYENLVKYEGDTLEIVPHLAESYEISEDGLTYTFKIRPGVTFSDGETFDRAPDRRRAGDCLRPGQHHRHRDAR
jgi:ABC-type transport system substrate-binding protein